MFVGDTFQDSPLVRFWHPWLGGSVVGGLEWASEALSVLLHLLKGCLDCIESILAQGIYILSEACVGFLIAIATD